MLDPLVFVRQVGLDPVFTGRAHVLQALGDPVNMLLNGDNHVGQHVRALRAGDEEDIRKPGRHQAEVGARTGRPFFRELLPALDRDVDVQQRAGDGVVAGRKDQRIELVVRILRLHALRRNPLDRRAFDIDQRHVVAVESFIVFGVGAGALGADEMVIRRQRLRRARAAHRLADLVADERGSGFIGLFVDH